MCDVIMTRISLISIAHDKVRRHLHADDAAVDATLGNGHDTLFLAQCVGSDGRVFGFDIQTLAIANTEKRLLHHGVAGRATLFHASHGEMLDYIPENFRGAIRAVMFNLGYLPGADKRVITEIPSTLAALDCAGTLLAEGGIITVLAYPGHPGGELETRQLGLWCENLDGRIYEFEIILSHYDQPSAPRLFVIRKRADLL